MYGFVTPISIPLLHYSIMLVHARVFTENSQRNNLQLQIRQQRPRLHRLVKFFYGKVRLVEITL